MRRLACLVMLSAVTASCVLFQHHPSADEVERTLEQKQRMAATIPENVRAEMIKNVPLARFGTTEEVANVVLFLCSPLASYVTGQTIEINGGWRG